MEQHCPDGHFVPSPGPHLPFLVIGTLIVLPLESLYPDERLIEVVVARAVVATGARGVVAVVVARAAAVNVAVACACAAALLSFSARSAFNLAVSAAAAAAAATFAFISAVTAAASASFCRASVSATVSAT
jgi:hypothetical protein